MQPELNRTQIDQDNIPSPKAYETCYIDTILVLPNLGADQGVFPLSGDQEIITYFLPLTLLICLKLGKDLIIIDGV